MEPKELAEDHPLYTHRTTDAKAKLISILTSKTVYASPMPALPGNPEAVCLTECVWDALVRHAVAYSRYGVVFTKRLIYDKGGGPSLYLRGDTLKAEIANLPAVLHPLVAPFDPDGALNGVTYDWLHEREWRLPTSLEFDYADVEYVIVDSIEDAKEVGGHVGGQFIPEHKYIPMAVYETIREAWRES